MKKHIATAVAIVLALIALLPGISSARLAANHNQTLLRG
jgi:hypothetical protein